MFKPASMVWTDLLVDRSAVDGALDALGGMEVIELRRPEAGDRSFPVELEPDEESVERLLDLERMLQPLSNHIPGPDARHANSSIRHHDTDAILPELEAQLRAWFASASPLVDRLRTLDKDIEELELLSSCLAAIPDGEFNFGALAEDGTHRKYPVIVALGNWKELQTLEGMNGEVIMRTYPLLRDAPRDTVVMVGTCMAQKLPELESQLHGRHWRFVRIPGDFRGSGPEVRQLCDKRIHALHQCRSNTTKELEHLNEGYQVAGLRGMLQRQLWVSRILADARLGQRFVWLSGWVPHNRVGELASSLDAAGVPFLLNTEASGEHGPPPVELQNPRWIRRFEAFVCGFGVPDNGEIDPSPILAVTTPLMFGYMFGDVGHGLVLTLAGLWLGRRLPVLGLLVPAGLASILFGFLFGSVFCSEHTIPALWIVPLQDPMQILIIPVAFGMLLILLSLALDAVQQFWKGQAVDWWIFRFPCVVSFLGLAGALLDSRALVAPILGALWVIIVRTTRAARTSGIDGAMLATIRACVEFAETMLQLFINTISFTRLGAFALAHAGLGTAVVILAGMPDFAPLEWMILVAGNALVIALEGLVVSIQTTRLVMFEFFRRFLEGRGRPFRPLRAPGTEGGAVATGAT